MLGMLACKCCGTPSAAVFTAHHRNVLRHNTRIVISNNKLLINKQLFTTSKFELHHDLKFIVQFIVHSIW